jgi:large subunit ribosomal protein L6
MVSGVNQLFEKKLIVEGIGYRANVKGSNLELALGLSHLINVEIPTELTVVAEKNNITITGIDKEKVGLFASIVRLKKKPEPYKGKGVRYHDEVIIRKEGKKNA